MTDGTGTSILQSALRRQQKKMEKEEGKAWRDLHRDATRKRPKEDQSVANVEYLESLHKRAKFKRQKVLDIIDN
jgi:arylsulfatase A-like enzyme